MKVFNHPQVGAEVTAEFLGELLKQGHIKYDFGFDDGTEIKRDDVESYLASDEDIFIHTSKPGMFIYWINSNGQHIKMADRRIVLFFYTDEE